MVLSLQITVDFQNLRALLFRCQQDDSVPYIGIGKQAAPWRREIKLSWISCYLIYLGRGKDEGKDSPLLFFLGEGG